MYRTLEDVYRAMSGLKWHVCCVDCQNKFLGYLRWNPARNANSWPKFFYFGNDKEGNHRISWQAGISTFRCNGCKAEKDVSREALQRLARGHSPGETIYL